MKIVIHVAIAQNGVIGRENGLPWRLSSDMRRFKAETMGNAIVMGRKTWESFPKRPLPGRLNIVVTRDKTFTAEGAEVVHSLDEALSLWQRSEELYRACVARLDRAGLQIEELRLGAAGGDDSAPPAG